VENRAVGQRKDMHGQTRAPAPSLPSLCHGSSRPKVGGRRAAFCRDLRWRNMHRQGQRHRLARLSVEPRTRAPSLPGSWRVPILRLSGPLLQGILAWLSRLKWTSFFLAKQSPPTTKGALPAGDMGGCFVLAAWLDPEPDPPRQGLHNTGSKAPSLRLKPRGSACVPPFNLRRPNAV
jgi:hypothetical protein